jgi:hypothetical protein
MVPRAHQQERIFRCRKKASQPQKTSLANHKIHTKLSILLAIMQQLVGLSLLFAKAQLTH